MKKIMVVFGTRPEAIKMIPVIMELKKRKNIQTVVCVTAQHREMLDQVLETFGIVPDYDLNIMKSSQSLSYITSSILEKIDGIMKTEKPDTVVVHGDTTTTFATSLAAFYNRIKIAHVEAGLRTYNKFFPYPEEINRQMVGLVADYNFAPTSLAAENLLREGKEPDSIFVTGNTAIDTLRYTIKDGYTSALLEWAGDSKLILLTAHRRENMGEPLNNIFEAINMLMEKFNDIKFIYPVHMNPEIQKKAKEYFNDEDRIKLVPPLDVLDFHNLIARSFLVLTDSGGIQEEAPSLNVPVLVLRNETERKEAISSGTVKLIGTDRKSIFNGVSELINDKKLYESMKNAKNPYGDGLASVRIADVLAKEGQ